MAEPSAETPPDADITEACKPCKRVDQEIVRYLVDKSEFPTTSPGIAYRISKRKDHKHESELAIWGTVVVGGPDPGDGWVPVGGLYLPLKLTNDQDEEVTVLPIIGYGWLSEFGCLTCYKLGRMPDFCICQSMVPHVRVTVIAPFKPIKEGDQDPPELAPGQNGVIVEIDERYGDIKIDFDGIEEKYWVYKNSLVCLSIAGKEALMKKEEPLKELPAPKEDAEDSQSAEMLLKLFERCDVSNEGSVDLNIFEQIVGREIVDTMKSQIKPVGSGIVSNGKDVETCHVNYTDLVSWLFPPQPPLPAPPPIVPTPTCKKGHPLIALCVSRDDGWACSGRYEPEGCRSGITGFGETSKKSRFRCEECDYDLCVWCYQQQEGLSTMIKCLRPTWIPPYEDWLTAGAKCVAKHEGRYYHEVRLGIGMDNPQVGWLTIDFKEQKYDGKGVGSDENGWAVDGVRHLKWHAGSTDAKIWPRSWQEDDIIGCAIDFELGWMQFSLNGEWVPGSSMSFDSAGRSLFPAVSMNGDYSMHITNDTWCFSPPGKAYQAWSDQGVFTRPRTCAYPPCKNGHPLIAYGQTQFKGWWCSAVHEPGGCLSHMTDGSRTGGMIAYSCNPCEYDLCLRCYQDRRDKLNDGGMRKPEELEEGQRKLLGVWEDLSAKGTFHILQKGRHLHYCGEQLHQEGPWMVAKFQQGDSDRFWLSEEGNCVMWQTKGKDSAWEPVDFATRRGRMADGAPLLTTAPTRIFKSVLSSTVVGMAPLNTRLVAAGPRCQDDTGVYMVPIRPSGAVELKRVRLHDTLAPAAAAMVSGAAASSPEHEKYLGLSSLWEALSRKYTVMIKGSWLLELGRKNGVPPKRQDLPPEAIWDPVELRRLVELRRVAFAAVSYCWLTTSHPDPEGRQLQILKRVIGMRLDEQTQPLDDLAIFLDWCSLYQAPETPAEKLAFAGGLANVHLWYSHAETLVWLMTETPEEHVPYRLRGWPTFERAVSGMITESCKLLDLGKLDDNCTGWLSTCRICRSDRQPPLIPEEFNRHLASKKFTDGTKDFDFVNRKYKETFDEVMGAAAVLEFESLDWNDDQVVRVAESLPHCKSCVRLDLSMNTFGRQGAVALAKFAPSGERLRELLLRGCQIGDNGLTALAPALPHIRSLSLLNLQNNDIGPRGAAALAENLPRCENLIHCHLAGNNVGIGDEALAVTAFSAAFPGCRVLVTVTLQRNNLSDDAKVRLRKAWVEDAGKPKAPSFLQLDDNN